MTIAIIIVLALGNVFFGLTALVLIWLYGGIRMAHAAWVNALCHMGDPKISLADIETWLDLLTGESSFGSWTAKESLQDHAVEIHIDLHWWLKAEAKHYDLLLSCLHLPVGCDVRYKVE